MSSSIRRETPRRTSKRRAGKTANQQGAGSWQLSAPCFACGGCGGLRLPHGVYPAGNRGAARPSGHGNAGLCPGAGRLEARARPLFRRSRPALTHGPGGPGGGMAHRRKRRKGAARESGKEYLLHISAISYIYFTYFRIPGILEAAVQAHDRKLPETAERFEGFE